MLIYIVDVSMHQKFLPPKEDIMHFPAREPLPPSGRYFFKRNAINDSIDFIIPSEIGENFVMSILSEIRTLKTEDEQKDLELLNEVVKNLEFILDDRKAFYQRVNKQIIARISNRNTSGYYNAAESQRVNQSNEINRNRSGQGIVILSDKGRTRIIRN